MSALKDYTKGKWKDYELYAPSEFWEMSVIERNKISNGCGSAQAAIDFVPDTNFLLDISAACDIHDVGYYLGGLKEDKYISDLFLLINNLQIIRQHGGNIIITTFRYSRAIKYFYTVDYFGDDSFNFIKPIN